MQNNSITVIVLVGFQNLHQFKFLLFFVLLIMFSLTLMGNFFIIILVSLSRNLHSPMYFFITQVSVFDILLATDIVPNMLSITLNEGGTISLQSCIAQFFFFVNAEATECLLLAVMSYDRCLAISNPFHYSTIMSTNICRRLIIFAWLLSFVMTLSDAIATCNLTFCGDNIIDHFFCDFTPLLRLACSDAAIVHIQSSLFCIVVLICPFITIVVSYIYIIYTIVKIPSVTGRKKAFSTCSAHLTVVCLFYGALISVYVFPSEGHSLVSSKVLALSYTVLTPLLNPFIYTFRNQDFQEAFRSWWHQFYSNI